MAKYAGNQEYLRPKVKFSEQIGSNVMNAINHLAAKQQKEQLNQKLIDISTDESLSDVQRAAALYPYAPELASQYAKAGAAQRLSADVMRQFGQELGLTQPGETVQNAPTATTNQPLGGGQVPPMMQNFVPQEQEQRPKTYEDLVKENPEKVIGALENAATQFEAGGQPGLARDYRERAKGIRKQVIADQQAQNKLLSDQQKQFNQDRQYAHATNKATHDAMRATADKLPTLELVLNMAEQAVSSGEVSQLSRANLAKRLGIKELNSPEGAALDFAVKQYLIHNISDVSAKGLNMFLEKVALSSFAQTGESEENNLIKLMASRVELQLAKAKTEAYQEQLKEDLEKYGAEQPFIDQRMEPRLRAKQKEIVDRGSYKIRTLKEQHKGMKALDKKWNKSVTQGTPLTPKMFSIIQRHSQSPQEAIQKAKDLGYTILSKEQIQAYE